MTCERCGHPLCWSERSWGQAYCRLCATALGLSRICDAPSLEVELDEIDIAGMTWDAAWTDEAQDLPFASMRDVRNARGADLAFLIQHARCTLHGRFVPCDLCRSPLGA